MRVASVLILVATLKETYAWYTFGKGCPQVDTVQNFDLLAYVSARWYVQEQMATLAGNPFNIRDKCSFAKYTITGPNTIAVNNYAQSSKYWVKDANANLCAIIPDLTVPSKLAVGPCNLPTWLYGPYWILAYQEDNPLTGQKGYVVVSGGQPTKYAGEGKCSPRQGINNSGLWIMTREQQRDDQVVSQARQVVEAMGVSTIYLNTVDQSSCVYPPGRRNLRGSVPLEN